MRKFIKSLARDESGVTALEYAILGGIVVAVLVTAGVSFKDDLGAAFTAIGTGLTEARS